MKNITKTDVYEMVKANILKGLEDINKGIAPEQWVKPWSLSRVRPMNYCSCKCYNGVNIWLLAHRGTEFLTFKQIQDLQSNGMDIKLKKGSKASPIVFFKWIEKEQEDEETGEAVKKVFPCLRYYNVFSLDDVEGLELRRSVETFNHDPKEAEQQLNEALLNYLEREKIQIKYTKSAEAFYMPSDDSISLPEDRYFEKFNRFLGTLAHEASHSTASRLGRDLSGSKGDEKYGYEELVAEFSSSLILSHFGVEDTITTENNVAYINSWMKAIKDMPSKKLIQAMQAAQKSANFILGISEDEKTVVD